MLTWTLTLGQVMAGSGGRADTREKAGRPSAAPDSQWQASLESHEHIQKK
jgi:hypothetical protein